MGRRRSKWAAAAGATAWGGLPLTSFGSRESVSLGLLTAVSSTSRPAYRDTRLHPWLHSRLRLLARRASRLRASLTAFGERTVLFRRPAARQRFYSLCKLLSERLPLLSQPAERVP